MITLPFEVCTLYIDGTCVSSEKRRPDQLVKQMETITCTPLLDIVYVLPEAQNNKKNWLNLQPELQRYV